MAKFIIKQRDPADYKDKIMKFWEKYLPNTPSGRLDWMNGKHAKDPSVWFFAFEEATGDLCGTLSIMPRTLYVDGKPTRAGILGDFVIKDKYRVFGPTMKLIKTAIETSSELGFQCLYTIPNSESVKVIERAGLSDLGSVFYFLKPIYSYRYLQKVMGPTLAKIFAPLLDFGIWITSKNTYCSPRGYFYEVQNADLSFDRLWDRIRESFEGIIGERRADYINWRYFQNPHYMFTILAYQEREGGDLCGYLVYSIHNNAIEIFDIISADQRHQLKLLKQVEKIARQSHLDTIYLTIFNNSLIKILKRCWYIDSKYRFNLFFKGDLELNDRTWLFFAGDRNI
jgi:hypothetical protein